MQPRTSAAFRRVRLAVPAAALLGLALAGCTDPATSRVPVSPTVPSEPAPSGSAAPSTPARPRGIDARAGTAGSDGLTVRYLDRGTVKTVRVEDFPR